MEKQLLEYVEQEFKRGVPAPMVKKALRAAGWDDRLIEEAFAAVMPKDVPPLPQSKNLADEDIAALKDAEPAAANPGGKSRRSSVIIFIVILVLLVIGAAVWFFNYWEPSVQDDFAGMKDVSPAAEIQENSAPNVRNESDVNTTAADEPSGGAATTTDSQISENEVRDAQRMADMNQLALAQKLWFDANSRYYTCGLAGGECGGKPYGYPSQIGTALQNTPQDPLIEGKPVCGKDYVYCGLNNAPYSNFFCYYAKLESGGYYTASHAGNFRRSSLPKIFEECAAAD